MLNDKNTRSRRRYRIVAPLMAAAALLAGCAEQSNKFGGKPRQEVNGESRQDWGTMRAGIKLQLARQQYDHGSPEQAVGLIEESLGWNPDSGDAYHLLAQCYLELGKVSAAHRAVERAAELGAASPELSSLRGTIAERKGQFAEAHHHYAGARALDDTRVEYLVAEAECLVALNRPDEASALLIEHLIDYDNDPSINALLGEIALRMGDEKSAARWFRSVVISGHHDPVVTEQYALLAVRAGDYASALATLQPLISQYGDALPASVARAAAKCQIALGQVESAKKTMRVALQNNALDLETWLLLAKAGIMSGDQTTTRLGAAKARRIAPHDPRTLLIDAYALIQDDKMSDAQRALTELLAQDENDVLTHCLLGMVAERENDLPAAQQHYRRALQIDPRCAWASDALAGMGAISS
jgi:Tfp pilus assembly protein PilF